MSLLFDGEVVGYEEGIRQSASIAVSPEGDVIYVSYVGSNLIFEVPIDGSPASVIFDGAIYQGSNIGIREIALASDGSGLYILALSENLIRFLNFDEDLLEIFFDSNLLNINFSSSNFGSLVDLEISPGGENLYSIDRYRDIFLQFSDFGSSPQVFLESSIEGLGDLRRFVLSPDGEKLYMLTSKPDIIFSVPIDGGGLSVAFDASKLEEYFDISGIIDMVLSNDGNIIYAVKRSSGISSVFSIPLDGGNPMVIFEDKNHSDGEGIDRPASITISPSDDILYVSDYLLGTILRIPLDNSGHSVFVQRIEGEEDSGIYYTANIAFSSDGSMIYVTSYDKILAVPISGESIKVVFDASTGSHNLPIFRPYGIVSYEDFIYVTENNYGRILLVDAITGQTVFLN